MGKYLWCVLPRNRQKEIIKSEKEGKIIVLVDFISKQKTNERGK